LIRGTCYSTGVNPIKKKKENNQSSRELGGEKALNQNEGGKEAIISLDLDSIYSFKIWNPIRMWIKASIEC
jgi:hypothetical protein